MSIVKFRWVNPNTDKTHIIGQFETDWKFSVGEHFHFWGGENKVQEVQIHLDNSDEYGRNKGPLTVTQIVTILPLWNLQEFGYTPESVWGDTDVVGEYDEPKETLSQKASLI